MNLLQRYGDLGLIPRNLLDFCRSCCDKRMRLRQSRGRGFECVVKGIEHCNAKRLMKKVGLVMRSTFDIYSPMQDVAPRAVRNLSNFNVKES